MPIVVTDLDGTVLDVRERFVFAQINALGKLGFDISANDVYPLVEFTMEADKFLDGLGLSLTKEQLREYFDQVEEEFYQGWKYSFVFPGVIDALTQIRPRLEGLRLITSRARVEETEWEVETFGLNRVFDKQVFSRGHLARAQGVNEIPLFPYVTHRKELIQFAIEDLEKNDEVWVIGDSVEELRAAIELGFNTIGVLTGFTSAEKLTSFSNNILNSIADLIKLL